MANPPPANTNDVLTLAVREYWLRHPHDLAQRLQDLIKGHQPPAYIPELTGGKYQLDSGNCWWMWFADGAAHLDYRYKTGSISNMQWIAHKTFIDWRLGDTNKDSTTPANDVITANVKPRWFQNPTNLARRVQDLVRGRTYPTRFDPVIEKKGWRLNPDGHWWLQLNVADNKIAVNFTEKSKASSRQWSALKAIIEWHLA